MSKTIRAILSHPGRAAALVAAALALILTIVPVSYQRVVGYEARLTMTGATTANSLKEIASQWQGLLGASGLETRAEIAGGVVTTTLTAHLPRQPRSAVAAAAASFARGLAAKGVKATANVEPRVEHALGSVYAMAAERLQEIRVDVRGKSEAQIEQEIRSRLQAIGMVDPEVKVTKTGNKTNISIHSDKAPTDKDALRGLTIGDAPDGKATRIEIHPDHRMTDAETKAEIEKQLKARGVDADVQVSDGRITIDKKDKK